MDCMLLSPSRQLKMNLIVKVDFGLRRTLMLRITADSPADTLSDEVERAFGLKSPVWKHIYKAKWGWININPVELATVLARAVRTADSELLKKRFGQACTIEDNEPVITLLVVKAVA